MRLAPFHKFIATISFSALSVGVLAWIFFWTMHATDRIRLEIAQINSDSAALGAEREHALVFARLADERPQDFERIAGYAVDPENPVAFIETLEGLAKKTNNQIKLDVGAATISEGELPFSISLEGAKNDVLKYLKLVELLPYELRVENFDFTSSVSQSQPKAGAGPIVQLRVALRVKTFLEK